MRIEMYYMIKFKKNCSNLKVSYKFHNVSGSVGKLT